MMKQKLATLLARSPDAHKNSVGRILVCAGSKGMTGAALLTARAALRSGAGIVRLLVPEAVVPLVDIALPEVITIGGAESQPGVLAASAAQDAVAYLAQSDVLIAGPGLRRTADTSALLCAIAEAWPGLCVLDADALTVPILQAFGRRPRNIANCVITPHPGEAGKLLDRTVAQVQSQRQATARKLAVLFQTVTVLKGADSVITDGQGASINPTGNPAMATAGMGDVLAGVIGALMAQGLPALEAAELGTYLHGLAGDEGAKEHGIGLMASDVIERLAHVLATI